MDSADDPFRAYSQHDARLSGLAVLSVTAHESGMNGTSADELAMDMGSLLDALGNATNSTM